MRGQSEVCGEDWEHKGKIVCSARLKKERETPFCFKDAIEKN